MMTKHVSMRCLSVYCFSSVSICNDFQKKGRIILACTTRVQNEMQESWQNCTQLVEYIFAEAGTETTL